jgi:hypothetical protein
LILKIGIFASFVAVMSNVAWVFAGTEPDPPPEAHPAEKSRTDEAIHTAVNTRLQNSDINFPIEQTSAFVFKSDSDNSLLSEKEQSTSNVAAIR